MRSDNQPLAEDVGKFRTTRWSAVLLSAQSQVPGSQAALSELCRTYWYPIYASVRYRGYSAEDAQDLTQGFFLHLLEHKALRQLAFVRASSVRSCARRYVIISSILRTMHVLLSEEETSNLFRWTRTVPNFVISENCLIR